MQDIKGGRDHIYGDADIKEPQMCGALFGKACGRLWDMRDHLFDANSTSTTHH